MADRADSEKDWVCVAILAGAHGVTGEVRVKCFTDDAAGVADFPLLYNGPGGSPIRLSITKAIKGGVAARLSGVDTREAAQALSGVKLYVPRADLPDPADGEEYYLADLVGLAVHDTEGNPVGRVQDVPNFGAGDLVEVRFDQPVKGFGRTALVPFERRWVPDVAIAAGYVTVDVWGWVDSQVEGGAS
mgnify:CR=1 FL=1